EGFEHAWFQEGLISVQTEDGLVLRGFYAPPEDSERETLVFFHGNAGNMAGRIPKMKIFMARGYGILMAEYRGYGGNPGVPREQGLYRDGRAYITWLRNHENVPLEKIALYGESL